jgi:hypothetical protein
VLLIEGFAAGFPVIPGAMAAGGLAAKKLGLAVVWLAKLYEKHCTLFVLCSQYVLFGIGVLACFDPRWPISTAAVACFEFGHGKTAYSHYI